MGDRPSYIENSGSIEGDFIAPTYFRKPQSNECMEHKNVDLNVLL